MMGAGLYTLLGLASTIAGVWVPLAFAVGGTVAAFSVYSYSKLGARFPGGGGAGEFLVRCFGNGVVAAGLNLFQFAGWIIAIALYAVGFGSYAAALIPAAPSWTSKAIGLALVVIIVVVNLFGSALVSRSELFVIVIELAILAVVLGFALGSLDPAVFATAASSTGGVDWLNVLFAAGLLFVTFEGFGVVTNSSGDMRHPAQQLPRSMYTALTIVVIVYVAVSAVSVMVMPLPEMAKDQGHVLAEVARTVMGPAGFVLLSVAALLATASAANATLYGDANLSYMMARDEELPRGFARGVWRGGKVGLFVAAGVTMAFVALFPLDAVGQMASLAFLIVYGSVNLGHLRVRKQTGANAVLLIIAAVLCFGLFALLLAHTIVQGQLGTWTTLLGVFALSFVTAILYRRRRRHTGRPAPD